ncbi:unnamed protein product, partial [Allacma fusca]
SYCRRPFLFVAGDNFCFSLKDRIVTQVLPLGRPRYPFDASITHFRKGFNLMTRPFFVDDDALDMDAASSFVTVSDTSWTLKGNTGEKLCLNSSAKTDATHYCLFDLKTSPMDTWTDIFELEKGCSSNTILKADRCFEFQPPNDEATCEDVDPNVPKIETATESTKPLPTTFPTTSPSPMQTTITTTAMPTVGSTSGPETSTIGA